MPPEPPNNVLMFHVEHMSSDVDVSRGTAGSNPLTGEPRELLDPGDREAPRSSRPDSWNRDPLRSSEGSRIRRTAGDHDSTRGHERRGERQCRVEAPGTSDHRGIERASQLGERILRARIDDPSAPEAQLSNCSGEKRGAPSATLQQGQLDLGSDDLDRNAWESGASAEVENGLNIRGEHSQEKKAVEQQTLHDPVRLGRTDYPGG